MATWQFSFHIIPRTEARDLLSVVGRRERHRVFDELEGWAVAPPPVPLPRALDGFMEETTAWSSELRIWGSDEGDRVELGFEDGRIESIYVRADLREVDLEFIAGIVRLAESCEAVILTEEMEICEPDVDCLVAAMLRSPAARFVADPEGFLASIDARLRSDEDDQVERPRP